MLRNDSPLQSGTMFYNQGFQTVNAKKNELINLLKKIHDKIDFIQSETSYYNSFFIETSFYDLSSCFEESYKEARQNLINIISLTEIYKQQGIFIKEFDHKIQEIKQRFEANIGPLTKDDLEAINKKIAVEVEQPTLERSSSFSM